MSASQKLPKIVVLEGAQLARWQLCPVGSSIGTRFAAEDSMARENDFRTDQNTADHIAEALKLQAQYGFDYARRHLQSLGIETQLALRMLAIRYDRRARPCALCRKVGT